MARPDDLLAQERKVREASGGRMRIRLFFARLLTYRSWPSVSWLLFVTSWLQVCACAGPPQAPAPELRQEAVALNEAGYLYYRQGKWRLAREKFRQALHLNRLIDHRAGIAANLNNLGVLAQEHKDFKEAQTCFQEALELHRQLGEPAGICEALNNLGTLSQARGNWAEAYRFFREAHHFAALLPPGPLLSLTLTHLGDVARHEQDYARALALYQQALGIDLESKDWPGRAVRWERLGRLYLALGDFSQAHYYLLQALEEARRLEYTQTITDALDGLVRLALVQKDQASAQAYGNRLIELYKVRGQMEEGQKVQALIKGEGGG